MYLDLRENDALLTHWSSFNFYSLGSNLNLQILCLREMSISTRSAHTNLIQLNWNIMRRIQINSYKT